jgi:lipoprotein-anchoring transpeptidase ErfK/SrfK
MLVGLVRQCGPRFAAALCVLACVLAAALPSGAATHRHVAKRVLHKVTHAHSRPSIVARASGPNVALYRSPTSPSPYATLDNPTATSDPLVFLASDVALAPYWVRVYLPMRPDGSRAWVRGSEVRLASDRYQVRADLTTHRLVVYRGSRAVIKAPVGVGQSVLPTPTGTYYIAELLKQPDPNGPYGPYAFGLSAFSHVLQSFGGGPGQIGLHGTDEPGSVGKNASHGCLRVSDALITKLAHLLPLGTPVLISR